MSTNEKPSGTGGLCGNRLWLGERREVAIYARQGVAYVAEFNNGYAARHPAAEWLRVNRSLLVRACRSEGAITPLTGDIVARIERLHRPAPAAKRIPFRAVVETLIGMVRGARRRRAGPEPVETSGLNAMPQTSR